MNALQNPSQQHLVQQLLTQHLDIWTTAESEKKSGRGRASGNAGSVYGIKKLRELILELAVRGKLVPQDQNDEPASELLKRIQAEKAKLIAEGKLKKEKPLAPINDDEKPFELPKGWEWVRLGLITNFGLTEKLNKITNDTWVLDLEDIEKDTSVILQKNRFSEKQSLSDKNSFKKGDVLYGKLRPYLNKVVVADEDGVCTTEILPIRCYGDFENKYFMYALKAPHFIAYVNARSYGMKMPRLGTDDGRNSLFPLAPLAEQHRIVAKVDELMALCDQLEHQHLNAAEAHETLVSALLDTLTQSQNAAEFQSHWQRIAEHFDVLFTTEASIDALKQTLLQLAVMGKLVPQDPNDEPASELLKRIQAEKAKLIAEGRLKKEKPLAPIGEDEKPFELPKGWEWTTLLAAAIINPRNSANDELEASFVPMTLIGTQFNESHNHEIRIWKDIKQGFTHFQEGDIGVAKITPCFENSKACVFDGLKNKIGAGTTELHIVRPLVKTLNPRYVLAYLKSPRFLYIGESKMTGTAGQKRLPKEIVESSPFPLPPVTEQNRIVAKVDALMALCDQLNTRIQQASRQQQLFADVLVEKSVN